MHTGKNNNNDVVGISFTPLSTYDDAPKWNTHAKLKREINPKRYACLSLRQDERIIQMNLPAFCSFDSKRFFVCCFFIFRRTKVQWYDYCTLHVICGWYTFCMFLLFIGCGWGREVGSCGKQTFHFYSLYSI